MSAVAEPTLIECGGFPMEHMDGSAGRKCVVGLSEQRVQELVAHMKPMSSKNKSGLDGHRLPGEIMTIRIYQAGKMEYELNRLRLLRTRRTAALATSLDGCCAPGRRGEYDRGASRKVLDKLHGADPNFTIGRVDAFVDSWLTEIQSTLTPEQLVAFVGAFDVELACAAFAAADADESGALAPEEVLPMLQAQTPEVTATMADVIVLFSCADVDGSGAIDKAELQGLLDAWRELVAQRSSAASASKSGLCAVL